MSELKKCPFCGGEGEVVGGNPYHWVFCKNCDAETKQSATIEGAIRIWNTRKPMDKIVEQTMGCFVKDIDGNDDGSLDYKLELLSSPETIENFSNETLLDEIRSGMRQ